MIDGAGFDADEPHRQGADGHPGDLPARRAVPDPGRRAGADRRGGAAHPRAPAAAAVRAPRHLRPLPVLPGLPAARPLHHRGPRADRRRSSSDQLGGESLEYTARVSESMLARLHFVVRPDAGRADRRRRRRRPRAPARRGGPVVARRLRRRRARGVRRGGGRAGWPGTTPTPSPRPTRRTTRRAPARSTSAGSRASRATAGSTCRFYEPIGRAARARRGSRSTGSGSPLSLSEVLPILSLDGRRGRRRAALRARRAAERPSRTSTTSGCATHRRAARPARASCSRTPSRGVGRATTRATASTRWCSRRADLAAGHGAARLREVHAPGRHAVRAGLHRGRAAQQRRHHPRLLVQLFEARFDPGRDGDLAADGEARRAQDRRARGAASTAPSTTSPASTTTGSCAPT